MAYGPEGQYTRHVDYYDRDSRFFGNDVTKFGGQRVMTALLYLTHCTGGETVFRKGITNAVGAASCQEGCGPALLSAGDIPVCLKRCEQHACESGCAVGLRFPAACQGFQRCRLLHIHLRFAVAGPACAALLVPNVFYGPACVA